MQLIQGDCLEVLKSLPFRSVDMVLVDLPYGTTQNKWDSVIPLDALWAAYAPVVKESAAFVFTASQPFTSVLVCSKPAWFKHEWIWKKNTATGHLNAKRMPMKLHESVVVFAKAQTHTIHRVYSHMVKLLGADITAIILAFRAQRIFKNSRTTPAQLLSFRLIAPSYTQHKNPWLLWNILFVHTLTKATWC